MKYLHVLIETFIRMLKFYLGKIWSIHFTSLCYSSIVLIGFCGCHENQHEETTDFLNETFTVKAQRMEWWRDAHFGMMIHLGPYSIYGGKYRGEEIRGIGDWIMEQADIPVKEYEQVAKTFHPHSFQATEWVKLAKEAGMKYIIFTAKHHDGFSLWNSQVSQYDVDDFTEFDRDILKELSKACTRFGIKFGCYYSIMDWHHPDAQAPFYPDYSARDTQNVNFDLYVQNYMKPQLREIIGKYNPSIIWFDGEWILDWTHSYGQEMYQFIRSIKPSIIINNRVDKGRRGMQGMNLTDLAYAGDFGTPEQEILVGYSETDWESSMTMNNTWGYKESDQEWKSAQTLIYYLIDAVAKGGNYLLNVGALPDGSIPEESDQILREVGKWMKVNGEAIYGRRAYPYFKEGYHIYFTRDKSETTVYVLHTGWPGNQIELTDVVPLEGSDIYMLGYPDPLSYEYKPGSLIIHLPMSLQGENDRPCKYAYTFKIRGKRKLTEEAYPIF